MRSCSAAESGVDDGNGRNRWFSGKWLNGRENSGSCAQSPDDFWLIALGLANLCSMQVTCGISTVAEFLAEALKSFKRESAKPVDHYGPKRMHRLSRPPLSFAARALYLLNFGVIALLTHTLAPIQSSRLLKHFQIGLTSQGRIGTTT